jgi:hypothetical protein
MNRDRHSLLAIAAIATAGVAALVTGAAALGSFGSAGDWAVAMPTTTTVPLVLVSALLLGLRLPRGRRARRAAMGSTGRG